MTPFPLALALALTAGAGAASATPAVTLDNTQVQACAFAGFSIPTGAGTCVARPGEFPSAGVSVANTAQAGPFPDPMGSGKVAQASSSTQAQFGVLRIDDLAGGLKIAAGNQPLLYANAISIASYSDVLTFRAPASMSTADFLASVADLNFGFSASAATGLYGGSVTLNAYARQGDFFPGTFRPGSARQLAYLDSAGVVSDPADRTLHLSLNNPNKERFVSFALTLELIGDARYVDGSAQATAWLSGISFSQKTAAVGALGSALRADEAAAVGGITVSSASTELVLDPSTGRFNYPAAAAVPEPGAWALFAAGLASLTWRRRVARRS